MAMVAYRMNGCSAFFTARTWPCSRADRLKFLVRRTNEFSFLKRRFQCSGQPIIFTKEKHFKVSSFKAHDHADVAEELENVSKCSKEENQLAVSTEEREEGETSVSGSIPSALMTGVKSQTTEKEKSNPILLWIFGLDVALKIPFMIFIPGYIIFRIIYGTAITRELAPLWIIGPLITTLYIKTIQGIFSLYLFSFKKAIDFLQNLPSSYTLVNSYLREILDLRRLKPILDIWNADYAAFCRERMKNLREWTGEIYLDYLEFIWPFYCRTIRFLRKANLV